MTILSYDLTLSVSDASCASSAVRSPVGAGAAIPGDAEIRCVAQVMAAKVMTAAAAA